MVGHHFHGSEGDWACSKRIGKNDRPFSEATFRYSKTG
jgi:hypothetical protein